MQYGTYDEFTTNDNIHKNARTGKTDNTFIEGGINPS